MKKLITLVIAAIMVLSMIPVMAISTSAAEVEGDWTIFRDPGRYEVEEGEVIKPEPGYEYTSEGFTTIACDWTNYTPFFTAQTKEAQPLKEGFYMEVRVDEYPYGGEDGGADHWISFNISDVPGVSPGSIDWGNNWLCLVRGSGNGSATVENFLTTKTTEQAGGSFAHQGSPSISIPMDDQNREIYTFEISWDGSAYTIKVNNNVLSNSTISNALLKWIESGEYYVGVTMHSGVSNATAGLTILKHGNSADNAVVPVGSDSMQPEDNMLNFAPKADPSTVEANQPALLWDATKTSFRKDPEGTDVILRPQGDNSYHVTATGYTPYWQWSVKSDLTYSISDFPVFCMVLKNFWGDNGGFYYCAGDIMSARNDYQSAWSIYDEGCMMFGENEEYSLVVVDMAALGLIDEALLAKDGRIHSVRPHFSVSDPSDPELTDWDVMYMGWFRSVEEAQQYAMDRLQMEPVTEPESTEAPETNAPETNVPETNAPETNVPETNVPETNAATADPSAQGGCSSVIGFSMVAILAAAAAAVALKKKN